MASRTKQWIVLVVAFVVAAVVIHDRYTPYTNVGYQKDSIIQMISTEVENQLQNRQQNRKTGKDPLRITEWWQASSLLKWDWEKPPEYLCGEMVKKGNWHVCMDKLFNIKPPCLVYSFGIWNDFSFDDAMGRLGCEVHSFDPSIGKKSHNRSDNVHFHDIGLSGTDDDMFVPTKNIYVNKTTTWKVRRLGTIKAMLGHADKHIDYLKMDVESSEWPALKDVVRSDLLSAVRQFGIEWHLFSAYPSKHQYVGFYKTVMAIKETGFRTIRSDFHKKNFRERGWRLQADVNYVNTLYTDL
ncbi:probable methyltransferase-like protein 24 [Haliotis rufescens]|uniref:probable methyltransferase-like protein 24 n=1 Tax=Haliotis rufescens TaxID=6454 RepID=UPI00201F151D|nr:probable methyltransferase-like protein 24 [Haliotis rufescens]